MAFRRNPTFEEELAREAQIRAELHTAANRAKARVNALASQDFGAEVIDDGDSVILTSTDPFAHLEEWGSANNPPLAPLRRGVRAAGFTLKESPKP